MKRTDKNGRVLMTGEQQLIDGSYEYRIMVKNRRYSICCDDLDELREEEKKFDLDKANLNEKPLLNTINDAYIQWAENKKGIKPNTFVNYKYSYEHYVKPLSEECDCLICANPISRNFITNLQILIF